MSKKVTIQDIADELGISRNTVSKAINNTGSIAEATKIKIFKKASEMGYKQFSLLSPVQNIVPTNLSTLNKEIALFTYSLIGSSHFSAHLIDTFQHKISEAGYKLSIYLIRDSEIDNFTLPANFNADNTDGIICIELFSQSYSQFLCEQNIPTLFVDTVTNMKDLVLNSDILYMENHTSVYIMLKKFIEHGKRNISFIGDRYNCQSFYERWQAYCDVLTDYSIPVKLENCIIDSDSCPYSDTDWLSQKINLLPSIPEVIFCANDFLAISAMKALKKLNISVPNDVLLCGFDNSSESKIIEPSLTTVNIPSKSMGYIAADLLLSRINSSDMPYRTTYIKTDVIFRDSTNIQ